MNEQQGATKATGANPRGGEGSLLPGHRLATLRRWVRRSLPGGIRERLFLLVAVAAVPMLVLQVLLYYQRHDVRRNQAIETESEVAEGVAMIFSAYLDGLHRQLDVVGQMILALPPGNEAAIERVLKTAAAKHPSIEGMNWVHPEGRILVSNLPQGAGRDISLGKHFRQVQAGESWAVGDLMEQGAILDNPIAAVAVAVRDGNGRLIGVVAAGIDPTRLDELTFAYQRHAGGDYTIFDGQGRLIYRDPPGPLTWEDRLRWQNTDSLLRRALDGDIAQGVYTSPVNGDRRVAARVPIPGTDWVAGAASPMSIAMEPVRKALFQDVIVGVVVTSLALVMATLAARTIADPLRRLEWDARAMGDGRIETSSDLQAPAEVRNLRGTVTTMAADLIDRADALRKAKERLQEQTEELQAQTEELRAANEALESREREYRTLAENSPEVIARFDRRLRHTYINACGARVYGVSQGEVLGKTSADLGMPADKVAFWKEHFYQVFATGKQQTVDFEFDSPTLGHQYFSSIFVPELDARGEVVSILTITRDVTATRKAEAALRSAALFPEENPSPVLRVARDGTLLYANAVSAGLLDLWNCRVGQTAPREIRRRVECALTAGEVMEAEIACGEVVYSFSIAPIASEGYVNLYGRDITERKLAAEALRQSEARHRRLIENLKGSHFVYVQDTDGVFRYISESITGILGYTPDEFLVHYETYLTDHPANQTARRCTELGIQGIRQPPFEVHTRHKDGSTRWLEVQEVPVLDAEGKVAAVEGVAQDITERKRAEEALRESERWFRTLANATPQLVWTAEPDGRVDYYNERYREYSGIEPSADGGFRWAPVLHPADVMPTMEAWDHATRTGQTYQIEHRVRRADGSYHWHLSRGVPLRDGNGRVVKWFGTATDIDDLKRAQEGLRRLTETLETRVSQRTAELEYRTRQLQRLTLELSQTEDRERRRLADVLHDDLQQQLAAVKFHLGLLGNRVRTDASLHRTAENLGRMLTNAIETSRSLSHELSPAMLYQADLSETLEWLAGQIRSKHGLDVRVHAGNELNIESDAIKAFLYRTAQELLFNVVKHARVGKADLRARRVGGYICLVVSDRGRGFDPQELKAASGFGLFSIRERVQLLGGRMRIRSARGKGSTFFIAVPDGPEPSEISDLNSQISELRASSVPDPPSSVLRVLVADDHEVVRQGLATLLREQPDIQFVGEAANGREAVDLASRLRPDVVVMDVAMPLMNGDEATRQTKLHLPHTRVVALSMYAEEGMAERMRRAGAEAYILKTAPADELLAAIRGHRPGE